MKTVVVKKEGYMFGAEDEFAELLHETLGYRLYSTNKHVKTGFPIIGYDTVKKRLSRHGVELYVEDMTEDEIYDYIVDHGYTISKEEDNEILFVLNSLIEGIDPSTGMEVDKESFLYDTLVQKALVQARDIVAKKVSRKKSKKLGGFEPTILHEDIAVIVDDAGEIKTKINLFHTLREWRLQKAKEERVSPFIVFYDKTLVAFATYLPKTKQEFLKMYGTGEFKWDKYGEEVIALIEDFTDSKVF